MSLSTKNNHKKIKSNNYANVTTVEYGSKIILEVLFEVFDSLVLALHF